MTSLFPLPWPIPQNQWELGKEGERSSIEWEEREREWELLWSCPILQSINFSILIETLTELFGCLEREMSEQRNRWNWEVTGFEPRNSIVPDDHKPAPLFRRYSISAASMLPHSDLSKQKILVTKLNKLNDKVQVYISLFINMYFVRVIGWYVCGFCYWLSLIGVLNFFICYN